MSKLDVTVRTLLRVKKSVQPCWTCARYNACMNGLFRDEELNWPNYCWVLPGCLVVWDEIRV